MMSEAGRAMQQSEAHLTIALQEAGSLSAG
jgi:hypothetical protein